MLLRMKGRAAALVAMGALVMLAGVVARGSSAVPVGQGRPLLGVALPVFDLTEPAGAADPVVPDAESSGWPAILARVAVLVPLVLLIAAIAAAVVLSVLAWLRRRRLGASMPVLDDDPGYADVPAARLLRAARQAQLAFDRHGGGPPSDAVIAAWVRLEEAAAGSGAGRLAHQTPTEFTDVLGAKDDTVRPTLDELRRLYQRARFARTGGIGAAEVAAARAALDEIVRGLATARVTA